MADKKKKPASQQVKGASSPEALSGLASQYISDPTVRDAIRKVIYATSPTTIEAVFDCYSESWTEVLDSIPPRLKIRGAKPTTYVSGSKYVFVLKG